MIDPEQTFEVMADRQPDVTPSFDARADRLARPPQPMIRATALPAPR